MDAKDNQGGVMPRAFRALNFSSQACIYGKRQTLENLSDADRAPVEFWIPCVDGKSLMRDVGVYVDIECAKNFEQAHPSHSVLHMREVLT